MEKFPTPGMDAADATRELRRRGYDAADATRELRRRGYDAADATPGMRRGGRDAGMRRGSKRLQKCSRLLPKPLFSIPRMHMCSQIDYFPFFVPKRDESTAHLQ
ncbi:hypothetical protein J2TS4_37760 [Paenibacillus sp. J2TS4]|nr:hypothetical protein J2TS4_37760 [Paenibacillus sp. J2TS4]